MFRRRARCKSGSRLRRSCRRSRCSRSTPRRVLRTCRPGGTCTRPGMRSARKRWRWSSGTFGGWCRGSKARRPKLRRARRRPATRRSLRIPCRKRSTSWRGWRRPLADTAQGRVACPSPSGGPVKPHVSHLQHAPVPPPPLLRPRGSPSAVGHTPSAFSHRPSARLTRAQFPVGTSE